MEELIKCESGDVVKLWAEVQAVGPTGVHLRVPSFFRQSRVGFNVPGSCLVERVLDDGEPWPGEVAWRLLTLAQEDVEAATTGDAASLPMWSQPQREA